MAAFSISKTVAGAGFTIGSGIILSDTDGLSANPTVLMAQPAQLTTRGGNAAGTITMANMGFGIISNQRFDLYWTGGQCYGITNGTVSSQTIAFTAVKGGSNLPSNDTQVIVGIPVQCTLNLVGNNITTLACGGSPGASSYFIFEESGGTDDFACFLLANDLFAYYTGCNFANPLAGDTTASVWISHSNTAAAVSTMLALAATH